MRELYVSLAAVGGLLLLLGVLGGLIKERTPVSEPLIALLAGVLIGPAALGLLDLAELGNETLILEQAALVTLGIALVGVALRLPVGYASGNWRLLVVLLGDLDAADVDSLGAIGVPDPGVALLGVCADRGDQSPPPTRWSRAL